MKKLTLALFCGLCLLITAPACAQTNDTDQAAKVVKAYYDTSIKGDVKAAMAYMSENYRAETEELLAETEGLLELGALLLKRSAYEIITVKQQDQNIVATVIVTMPDMDYIFFEASEGMDSEENEEAFTRLLIKQATELVVKQENIPLTENETTIVLIKENDQWKIDEEY